MKYLIKITPLEPYTFGTDQNIRYPGEEPTGKETYFVDSGEVPEQTTIFGLIRYMILEHSGVLDADFNYDGKEDLISNLIGENSFSFNGSGGFNFGKIRKVSPLFLMNDSGEYLVRNPLNNKSSVGYRPFELEEEAVTTSFGTIRMPKAGEYNPKEGLQTGYINLTTKKVENALFQHIVSTRIRTEDKEDDDNFFKVRSVELKKGFSFAVFAETDGELLSERTICYMGRGKSAFLIESMPHNNDLEDAVKACFQEGEPCYYALSDLYPGSNFKLDTFSIIREKRIRNLMTRYLKAPYLRKINKSPAQFYLVGAGSVFYGHEPAITKDAYYLNAGYNSLIKIGGSTK